MTSSEVICREVREDDYAAVHTLRASEGMGDKDSPELWQRLYFKNPALKRHSGHWPLGWVLETEGDIVGYIGNIPQVYAYQDQTLYGALGSGMVVHPDYRGKSRGHTAQMIQSYCNQTADFLFNTTANIPAGKLWSSYGFTEVPDTELTAGFSRRTPSSVKAALQRKKYPKALTFLVSYPISCLLNLKNKLKGMNFKGKGPVKQIDHFDEKFDRFWSKFLRQQTEKLVKVSDREMLSWHFSGLIRTCGGSIIIKEDSHGNLIGYTVLVEFLSGDHSTKQYWLADLKALDITEEIIDELLLNVFQVCKENHVNILATRGFPALIRNRITRFNPRMGKSTRGAFLKIPESSPYQSLLDPGIWFFTPFDGDAII